MQNVLTNLMPTVFSTLDQPLYATTATSLAMEVMHNRYACSLSLPSNGAISW